MRIVFSTPTWVISGVNSFTHNLMRSLQRRGHDVELLKIASSLKSVGDQDGEKGSLPLRPILLFGPAEPSFRPGRTPVFKMVKQIQRDEHHKFSETCFRSKADRLSLFERSVADPKTEDSRQRIIPARAL